MAAADDYVKNRVNARFKKSAPVQMGQRGQGISPERQQFSQGVTRRDNRESQLRKQFNQRAGK